MRSYRVYSRTELSEGKSFDLDERSSHHLARVLRIKPGDRLTAFNGNGINYFGEAETVGKSRVSIKVTHSLRSETESPLRTHLGLAVSKGDRFDWAIKKATELGVAGIYPVLSQRVDVRLSPDRWRKKCDHWQQVVISACEQSGRAVIPEVSLPQPLDLWVNKAEGDCKVFLHPGLGTGIPTFDYRPEGVALLIGPEGGFTEEEVVVAKNAGFQGITLGPRVLRTETAPLVALSVLGAQWGDINA